MTDRRKFLGMGLASVGAAVMSQGSPAKAAIASANTVYINVLDYRLDSLGNPRSDKDMVQAAYDDAKSQSVLGATVVFPPNEEYHLSGIKIHSGSPITTLMHGAYLIINDPGVLFDIKGSKHRFYGGHIRSESTSSTETAFKIDNSGTTYPPFAYSNFCLFSGIDTYGVHTAFDFYMDSTGGHASYRHTIENCVMHRASATLANSYGIRLHGNTARNSAGNDTKIINCMIHDFETNVSTNGVGTKLVHSSLDGGDVGLLIDGASNTSVSSCYFEYNTTCLKFINNPYTFTATNSSFAPKSGGVVSTGSLEFNTDPQFLLCDNAAHHIGGTVNIKTNQGTGLVVKTNTGAGLAFEDTNGVTRFKLSNSGYLGVGDNPENVGLYLGGGQTVGSTIKQVNTSRPNNPWKLYPNYNSDDYLLQSSSGVVLRLRKNGRINMPSLPTYGSDSNAGAGGLVAGDLYKTSSGDLRIKL